MAANRSLHAAVCSHATVVRTNKKTAGKVMSNHTPKRKNRLNLALQRAANAIGNNLKDGEF